LPGLAKGVEYFLGGALRALKRRRRPATAVGADLPYMRRPLRPGGGEPGGEPWLLRCPADVAPDTILPFLTRRWGEVIGTAWTSSGFQAGLPSVM
jgi:hypothetical protein